MQQVALRVGRGWRWDPEVVKHLSKVPTDRADHALRDVIDTVEVLVNGRNLAAEACEDAPFSFLYDLMSNLTGLHRGRRSKAITRFYEGPWELVVVRRVDRALISFYNTGANPEIIGRDIRVSYDELVHTVTAAAEALVSQLEELDTNWAQVPYVRAFRAAINALRPNARRPSHASQLGRAIAPSSEDRRSSTVDAYLLPLRLLSRIDSRDEGMLSYAGENAFDLHSLLLRGELSFVLPDRTLPLPEGYVFLALDGFLSSLDTLLATLDGEDSRSSTQFHDGSSCYQVSYESDTRLIEISVTHRQSGDLLMEASGLPPEEFILAVLEACHQLANRILEANPLHRKNGRLTDFLREITHLATWHADQVAGSFVNTGDQQLAISEARHQAHATQLEGLGARRAGFRLRWRFDDIELLPHDLTPTTHGLLARSGETALLLDRSTGALLGQLGSSAQPVAAVAALPDGVVLLQSPRTITVVDLPQQDIAWSVDLTRPISPPSMRAVVASNQGRELLIVALGNGSIEARQRRSGELVWRFNTRRASGFELIATAALLYASADDRSIYALDPSDGSLRWRYRAPGGIASRPLVHGDRVLLCAGEGLVPHGSALALDAFSGELIWERTLGIAATRGIAILGDSVFVSARRKSGGVLCRLGISDGSLLWEQEFKCLGIDDPTSPCLADDAVLVKTDLGELLCFDTESGVLRWHKQLAEDGGLELVQNLDLKVQRGLVYAPASRLHVLATADGRSLSELPLCLGGPQAFALTEGTEIFAVHEMALEAFELKAYIALVSNASQRLSEAVGSGAPNESSD